MGQAKGGKKLRRSAKHKNKYQAQFLKTAANKTRKARSRLHDLARGELKRLRREAATTKAGE